MTTINLNKNNLSEAISKALQTKLQSYNREIISILPETFDSKMDKVRKEYSVAVSEIIGDKISQISEYLYDGLDTELELCDRLGCSELQKEAIKKDYIPPVSFASIGDSDDFEFMSVEGGSLLQKVRNNMNEYFGAAND